MIKLIMRLKKHLSKNSNRDERQQIASKLFSSVTSSLYRSSIRAIWVLVGQLLKLHQLSVILLIRPLQVLHVLHHHLGGLAHAFLLLHNTEHKVALAVHQRSMKEPGLLWPNVSHIMLFKNKENELWSIFHTSSCTDTAFTYKFSNSKLLLTEKQQYEEITQCSTKSTVWFEAPQISGPLTLYLRFLSPNLTLAQNYSHCNSGPAQQRQRECFCSE